MTREDAMKVIYTVARRMKATGLRVSKMRTQVQGRFVIAAVRGAIPVQAMTGLGCAHCSIDDEFNPEIGERIALSRAARDLIQRLTAAYRPR